MNMNGFFKGMIVGALTGAAAEMALQTSHGKKTKAGKTMQAVTDAVDSAASSVKNSLDR